MTTLKTRRIVTYRKAGIPAIILEGKWLEKLFGFKIGGVVNAEYYHNTIILRNIEAELKEDQGFTAYPQPGLHNYRASGIIK